MGVGVAVIHEGNLLLVKRGRDPGKGLWAVPGGKVRRGESLVAAAAREVKEETGLNVSIGEVVWVGEHISETDHIVLIDFSGSVESGVLRAGDDAVETTWVPLESARDFDLTPTMYDLVDLLTEEVA